MEEDTYSLFDRAAIAFGALVLGFGAGLSVGLPLLLIVGVVAAEISDIGALFFWKVPLLLGLIFGAIGFVSPGFAADWLGKTWQGVVYIWRVVSGH